MSRARTLRSNTAGRKINWIDCQYAEPRAALRMLFECAICFAITALILVGLVGLLLVLRIEPF
jgi:hypothetical protein